LNSSRLAWPLAISLTLHLCLGWLFSPGSADTLARGAKAVTLTVVLASKEHPAAPAPAAAEPAPAPALPGPPAAPTDAEGILTQKARFLAAPDLSDLEQIAVPLPGRLVLRLHVSALGTVDGVTVVESDPLPKELLDGLLDRFGRARLSPAQAGSQAVASTLDLVIRYESAPMPLQRGR
jgi:outer membrane biosynthesis protein TonB